jgi:tyrosyl-DNA phosphodiesterase-1
MILATLRGPPEVETDPEATESESETDDSSEIEVVESKNAHKEDGRPHAWLYVGSHNFTPSAWGTLSGSGFSPVLNVRRRGPSGSG